MDTQSNGEDDLRERVGNFLQRNFPQIWMHGGTAAIESLDAESGTVTLQLGGACSGCGISPMTVEAIKGRMAKEIPEIETVHASTGQESMGAPQRGSMGGPSRGQAHSSDEQPDTPF